MGFSQGYSQRWVNSEMPSFEPVRAILRGFEILRIINESGPISATEIAGRSKLPQPTVVRILETLISAGYVCREAESAGYGVTAKTLALSQGFDANSRLVQLAKPLIEDLRAKIGWPSNLATFEHDAMSIAYTNRRAYGMSVPGRLGATIPLLVTGVGIAYLANLPNDECAAVLARLKHSNSRWDTDPDVRKDLHNRLEAACRNGYALADQRYLDEIYQSQIWAVAVPIIADGKVVAALSSLVLRSAGPRKRILSDLVPVLKRTAAAIAGRLSEDAGTRMRSEHRGTPRLKGIRMIPPSR